MMGTIKDVRFSNPLLRMLVTVLMLGFSATISRGQIVTTVLQDTPSVLDLAFTWNDVASSTNPALTNWFFQANIVGPVTDPVLGPGWQMSGSLEHLIDPDPSEPGESGVLINTVAFMPENFFVTNLTRTTIVPHGPDDVDFLSITITRTPQSSGPPIANAEIRVIHQEVPEPTGIGLFGVGVCVMIAFRWRGRRKSRQFSH